MDSHISPLGRSAEEAIAKRMLNPEYRRHWLEHRIAVNIGDTVILARGARGWTQAQLGRAIGTTGSVISRLESGRHKVSVATLRKLANILDVTFIIGPDPK